MSKTVMPSWSDRVRNKNGVNLLWGTELIKITKTIVAEKSFASLEVLQRKTKRVKFHGNKIITGKFANQQQVFDNIR